MSKSKFEGLKPINLWLPEEVKTLINSSGLGISGFMEFVAVKELLKRSQVTSKVVRTWIASDKLRESTVAKLEGEGLI